jgi:hypothetical protein
LVAGFRKWSGLGWGCSVGRPKNAEELLLVEGCSVGIGKRELNPGQDSDLQVSGNRISDARGKVREKAYSPESLDFVDIQTEVLDIYHSLGDNRRQTCLFTLLVLAILAIDVHAD